jgi:hypothetical protein
MPDLRGRLDAGASAPNSVVHPGAGLRLRLWLGCLLGGLAGAGATLGLLAWLAPSDPLFDPAAYGIWPWSAAFLCVALSVGLALWLDYGIAAHLRGLSRAIAGAEPAGLSALPSAAGWGELSLLTAQLQSLLVRQREMGRAALELDELRHRIRSLRVAIEMRAPGQRAEPLRPLEGPLGPLIETFNRLWSEEERAGDSGRDEALGLRRGLTLALADARDSAEQAERGFVESTALLTTVRELQRLGGELREELATLEPATPAREPDPDAVAAHRRYREAAAAAIEELVSTSNESVERLAAGLLRVTEIGEHVQVLANRATLIALNVSLAGADAATAGASAVRPEGLSDDLRALAGEVRTVTDLTTERFAAIDREVAAAAERMKGLRERVAAKLDEAPPALEAAPEVLPAATGEAALRLLERVREMVQDAAAKGERLSATGERASRAAERLARRLEEESATLEDLALRLGASAAELRDSGPAAAASDPGSRPADLRLLGPEDARPAAEPGSADGEDAGESR